MVAAPLRAKLINARQIRRCNFGTHISRRAISKSSCRLKRGSAQTTNPVFLRSFTIQWQHSIQLVIFSLKIFKTSRQYRAHTAAISRSYHVRGARRADTLFRSRTTRHIAAAPPRSLALFTGIRKTKKVRSEYHRKSARLFSYWTGTNFGLGRSQLPCVAYRLTKNGRMRCETTG